MEFVDYKCLESLLIEGEELIATEGFIDTVKKKITDFFRMIGRLITKFIGIIKAKFGKGKSGSKFSSEELKKMGIDTFEPDTIKPDTFEPAKKNPPSDEDAKKVADSIKQRYENSGQYKKHKADSEEVKKQFEEARAAKTKDLLENKKRKNCSSKIYHMFLDIGSVEKHMYTLVQDLYKLTMSHDLNNSSELNRRFDIIGEEIDKINDSYDIINNNIDDYYLDFAHLDTKETFINELNKIKVNIDRHIAEFEKEDKAYKQVWGKDSKQYNTFTPMMKNCSKVTTLISNIINLVNRLDTNP